MPKPRKTDDASSSRPAAESDFVPFSAADRRYDPSREKTVQSSVSLRPSQWRRLDVVGDLTQWGRGGALSQAVDLLTSLPIPLAQRVATLSRTTARETLLQHFRSAVAEAVEAAEAELPDHAWAEFDAALIGAEEDLRRSRALEMSEEELIAAAKVAQQQYRRGRGARK
jgi:hypothetical protein